VKPKIAVLLSAYNGLAYLSPQVESIVSQQQVEITLFVSVDFSNDGTQLWFEELANSIHVVRVLSYGQRFGSAALNFYRLLRDVDFSDFDFIAFADQDDIWMQTWWHPVS